MYWSGCGRGVLYAWSVWKNNFQRGIWRIKSKKLQKQTKHESMERMVNHQNESVSKQGSSWSTRKQNHESGDFCTTLSHSGSVTVLNSKRKRKNSHDEVSHLWCTSNTTLSVSSHHSHGNGKHHQMVRLGRQGMLRTDVHVWRVLQ